MLARVADILRPTIPDFPIPVTTTRPRQAKINSTARTKSWSSFGIKLRIASASIFRTSFALSNIIINPSYS